MLATWKDSPPWRSKWRRPSPWVLQRGLFENLLVYISTYGGLTRSQIPWSSGFGTNPAKVRGTLRSLVGEGLTSFSTISSKEPNYSDNKWGAGFPERFANRIRSDQRIISFKRWGCFQAWLYFWEQPPFVRTHLQLTQPKAFLLTWNF